MRKGVRDLFYALNFGSIWSAEKETDKTGGRERLSSKDRKNRLGITRALRFSGGSGSGQRYKVQIVGGTANAEESWSQSQDMKIRGDFRNP